MPTPPLAGAHFVHAEAEKPARVCSLGSAIVAELAGPSSLWPPPQRNRLATARLRLNWQIAVTGRHRCSVPAEAGSASCEHSQTASAKTSLSRRSWTALAWFGCSRRRRPAGALAGYGGSGMIAVARSLVSRLAVARPPPPPPPPPHQCPSRWPLPTRRAPTGPRRIRPRPLPSPQPCQAAISRTASKHYRCSQR